MRKNGPSNSAFSSEDPFERWFGLEILGHKSGEIRMGRIGSGTAPLLKDHDRTRQIGVVESVRVVGTKGRAVVRFSKRGEAADEFEDIVDGIRGNVSVGYQVHAMEKISETDGTPTYRVTDWEPMEVSIVSIPADQTVGVGRHKGANIMPIEITNDDNNHQRPRDIRRQTERETREDIQGILSIGKRLGFQDEASQWVQEGRSLKSFQTFAMEELERRTGNPPQQRGFSEPGYGNLIGLTRHEAERYSIVNVLRCLAFPNEPKYRQKAAFELECSEAAAKLSPTETRGIRVPTDINQNWQVRALSAGTATDGAELVATNLLAGSFIDVLRNLSVAMSMGATVLHGLVGNVSIPRKTSGSVMSWVTIEGGNVGNSEPQFDNVTLSPKHGGHYCDMTRNLLLQSTPAIEGLIRADLAAAVATGIDLAAMYGTGADGQPKGIANQTGINAPTNFAARCADMGRSRGHGKRRSSGQRLVGPPRLCNFACHGRKFEGLPQGIRISGLHHGRGWQNTQRASLRDIKPSHKR